MKAWIVSDRTGNCPYTSLVFANSVAEAKKQANYDSPFLYQGDLEILDWTDIFAKRAKEFDNMENTSEKEICLKLMREYSWWFEIENEIYTEDNMSQFNKIWE